MPTEVRILRSSSTSAIVGIFLLIPVFGPLAVVGMKLEQIVAEL
jgi:hypothetical protein